MCSGEGGQTVANRFVSDENILGVIGHMCSSSCNAAAPIYDAAGYTSISGSCTAPAPTMRGYTSFNRAVTTDITQGVNVAKFLVEELEVSTIATIHDGSDYGDGLVAVVAPEFEDSVAKLWRRTPSTLATLISVHCLKTSPMKNQNWFTSRASRLKALCWRSSWQMLS